MGFLYLKWRPMLSIFFVYFIVPYYQENLTSFRKLGELVWIRPLISAINVRLHLTL